MTSHLVALCFDANDPVGLARFWAEGLRWTVAEQPDGDAMLLPTDGTPFRIDFLAVPEAKDGKNRIHLDLTTESVDDQRETVARLLEVGGRHVDIGQGPDDTHVVLADPEGNELCILAPNNNFLAGAGRLGAINCDGLQETGYFWAAVLGWPLVWDQDEETAIRVPSLDGPLITWSGPPLIPKLHKNRLHLDVAASDGVDQHDEVERLVALGATRVDVGQGDVSWVVLADPDGNEFCVLRG